ncbi:hypothetical protein H310_01937 [Aphanomyces invadans]|uniref:Uncharacterized protein n=1 Tax=Aphanomyces invadans TaxID=157072 RepID=A0A024UMC0_9STRA|nr:hypothetical protein H310_01937 [Aphanomyces invadans]ETW07414.1 hypothetical protein H310_01937 [Aphanomyces invadans]|eukprot:XP_008863507.1 hypothetical protein H310_01937 [Aphanomyces invadans]
MGSTPSSLHYDGTQVSLLPQFVPLAKCVTVSQVEALGDKLSATTKTAFCTVDEFRDLMGLGPHLDLYLRYLFESLKTTPESEKIHVMDLLAALAVCTSTSASLRDKLDVLCTLFTHKTAQRLKESDVAILFFSAVNGLKKITIGLEDTWNATGRSTRDIAKELTSACCLDMVDGHQVTKPSLPRTEFIAWCLTYKPVVYVLRHFIPGDILNPSTVLANSSFYSKLAKQTKLYETLLGTMNPSENLRIESLVQATATVKIQAMWKRHVARRVMGEKRAAKNSTMNGAAITIQNYAKKKKNFVAVMQRAAVERMALNGALLTFGSGIGVGSGNLSKQTSGRGADMVAELKLQGVRSRKAFVSSSCTFVDTDQGWMMWGQCLPMYSPDTQSTTFSHAVPKHIDLKVDVASVACGRGHCLVLDTAAMVHSWGWNDHGQTGHGSTRVFRARHGGRSYKTYYDERTGHSVEYLDAPLKLPYFTGDMEQDALPIPIRQIAAGDFFSMVLSTDGQVFSWGEGSDGQLGLGLDCPFEVGYVEKRLAHSAFTFTHEPRAVAGLSHVQSIAACGNRSTALTVDQRVFEWGDWGRMLGEHTEPAFQPVEKDGASGLGLCKVAIGAEHTVAEGASVWLDLPEKKAFSCFVMLAEHACSIDTMRRLDEVQVVSLGFHFDDCEDDQADLPKPATLSRMDSDGRQSSASTSSNMDSMDSKEIEQSILSLLDQLWVNRAHDYVPSLDRMKTEHPSMQSLQWPLAVKTGTLCYNDIVDEILIDIAGRVVCIDVCPPEGYYVELIAGNAVLLEVPTCPTSTSRRVTNRGVWSSLVGVSSAAMSPSIENQVALIQFTPDDLCMKAAMLRQDNVVDCITASLAQKVVALQEAGALAVVVGFDFHNTEPFMVDLPVDEGLYIPVFLLDVARYEQVNTCLASREGPVDVRMFHRPDNTPRLIRAALQHGAAGVLLHQRAPVSPSSSFEEDTSQGDPYIYPHPFDTNEAPFVGMVSHCHGQVLRLATHLDQTNHMVVAAKFRVQDRGQFYSWGCAANGRLGVGAMAAHPHLTDGYDARTDSSYRCATLPVVVPALCGRDIADVVCGAAHSMARTSTGRVFTWGQGKAGQLGHRESTDKAVPTLVTQLGYEVVVEMAANDICSTVVCETLPTDRYDQRRKEILLLKAAKRKG